MKLKTLLTILSTIIVIDALFVPCGAADDARRQAAHRQRRMIFNNDGDDAWVAGAPATKEGLLSLRMDHIGDCGVDTVFYCTTMSINSFTHDSQVTEVSQGDGEEDEKATPGIRRVQGCVLACVQHNTEKWASTASAK